MAGMVDTIDLTLSSPEPQLTPQSTPRQSQLPTYFKREKRPYSTPYAKHEHDRRRSSVQTAGNGRQTRHDNIGNIHQIVNSSDPAILKKVLLELCQMSPALCGAVARGLASHSRTSHGAIRERAFETPAATKMNNFDSNRAHERFKQRSNTRDGMLGGLSHVRASQVQYRNTGSTTHTPGTSRPVPRVKHEYPLGSPDSGFNSDELQIPGNFPRSAHRANSGSSRQNAPQSSSALNSAAKPLSLSERLAIIKQENSTPFRKRENPTSFIKRENLTPFIKRENPIAPKRCTQCRELFINEEDMCMYHPGSMIDQKDEGAIWSCCKGLVKEALGCELGKHIDPEKRFQPAV